MTFAPAYELITLRNYSVIIYFRAEQKNNDDNGVCRCKNSKKLWFLSYLFYNPAVCNILSHICRKVLFNVILDYEIFHFALW